VAPLLLAFAVVKELAVMPAATWWPRLVGSNGRACLTLIPLLSIGRLACTLLALRHGAPGRPTAADHVDVTSSTYVFARPAVTAIISPANYQ
jgi:hypothetical protein